MLVLLVLILRRISGFRDITRLFLRYTRIHCANTPTPTQTAELSPTVQVFFEWQPRSHTVNVVSTVVKDKANGKRRREKPRWNRREEGRTDGGGGMLHPAEHWLLVAIQEDGSCKPHTARLSAFSIRKSYILQTAPARISGLCAATSWLVATLSPISYVCILYIHLDYVQRQCLQWMVVVESLGLNT